MMRFRTLLRRFRQLFNLQNSNNPMKGSVDGTYRRRSAERLEWRRVTERRFFVYYFDELLFDEPDFVGYVTLLCIERVREPLWLNSGGRLICVADDGYMWLQHFPHGAHHAITTQFNAAGNIMQWYIDICKRHGIDERGIPWWDDLYLDIVITPKGSLSLLDEDELDDALRSGEVSAPDVALAYAEAQRVMEQIEDGKIDLLTLSCRHRDFIVKLMLE